MRKFTTSDARGGSSPHAVPSTPLNPSKEREGTLCLLFFDIVSKILSCITAHFSDKGTDGIEISVKEG